MTREPARIWTRSLRLKHKKETRYKGYGSGVNDHRRMKHLIRVQVEELKKEKIQFEAIILIKWFPKQLDKERWREKLRYVCKL